MNTKNIAFLIALTALAACNRGADMPTEYTQYDDNNIVYYQAAPDVALPCDAGTSMIKYSVPTDSDLTLETAHHVIQIQGNPNQSYAYYVWAGNKDYADDADLIVTDGVPAVLVDE